MLIIVRDGKPHGRTRSGTDEVLRKEGWGSSFTSEEAADKCAFLERKIKKVTGADDVHVPARAIDSV